jgi:biotin transporter BioY
MVAHLAPQKALLLGFLPFVPCDALKAVAAARLAEAVVWGTELQRVGSGQRA